jgi:hypothetical protein
MRKNQVKVIYVNNELELLKVKAQCAGSLLYLIGTSCYHGLCDLGESISAIPYSSYLEVNHDIEIR